MRDIEVTRESIVERAMADQEFKKRLLDNPVKTLQTECKINIPKGIQLTVLEEKPDHWYLVIPTSCQSNEDDKGGGGGGVTW